jgi:hypothetical protein
MTFKIFLRKLIGIKVFKKELQKLAKAFMPQDKETSIKASLHSRYDISQQILKPFNIIIA